MTKKEKIIEKMDISLGELLNEIHYMEIAVERMKEKFENRGEHYLSILENYEDTVKFYRFDFARFSRLRNLAIAGKLTLEKLKMYSVIIKDVIVDIQKTSDTVIRICIVEGAVN